MNQMMRGNNHFSDEAFGMLYDEYKNRIYGYALAITHSPHDAEEITQELFIKLWNKRETLDSVLNMEHYIFTMARNRTLNYIKKAARNDQLMEELKQRMTMARNDVEDRLIGRDYEQMVEEALSQLSPKRRLVFRLSRYQGKKLEEIAGQLDLSRNTVKNHLAAALKFVRAYLTERGATFLLVIMLLFLQ